MNQNPGHYEKVFAHDVEAIKVTLDKDIVFWKKKEDQAQLAPKKIQANITKFLEEQQKQLAVFVKMQKQMLVG